jgi:hypothetical protein
MEATTATTVNAQGYSNESILKMKEAIKTLAAEQKSLKPQRKTVHFKGERTVSPSDATWKHQSNRWDIRHMLYAYAKMRGRDPMLGLTKKKDSTYISDIKIDQILKAYLDV